jgi:3-phenylpropionate/trans-cinnamate dioxygenase ferredoxin reductase subunit
MSELVILGAGQAAAQLAASLRQGGYAAPIRMIGDEPFPPYQRPPLSKKFLADRLAPDRLYLRPEKFWHEHQVTLDLGVRATAVDRGARRVTLSDGREIGFETLVLATGTRAGVPPVPGLDLAGVFFVRRIEDIQRLRPALDAAQRVVIVGGGYIGLEVAAVMRAEGRTVTVLEAEDRVMKRVTSPVISAFFDRFHRAREVDIKLGSRLAAVEGEGRVKAVRLADGNELPADLVLVATGARPNDELAAQAGLASEDGVAVDEHARTSDPAIYAIGDCTRFPSGRYGRRVRLECVQNAIDQAKAAASAILGKPQPYDPVPWFWSDQYEVKLQMAGLCDGFEDAKTVGDPAGGRFSVEYRRGGRLIAVDAINDGRAYMTGRQRLAEETARA